jgi:alpha-N-arabinofuranosidase
VLRQSIWYPYAWALEHAKGRVLDLLVESDTYPIRADGLRADFARDDDVPYLDVAVTLDRDNGEAAVFVLNRDLENERELELDWKNLAPESVAACQTLTGDDLKAFNTFDAPRRVAPQELDAPKPGRSMTLKLPAASYTVLSLKLD